jgi:hypothetical protein
MVGTLKICLNRNDKRIFFTNRNAEKKFVVNRNCVPVHFEPWLKPYEPENDN